MSFIVDRLERNKLLVRRKCMEIIKMKPSKKHSEALLKPIKSSMKSSMKEILELSSNH
jgi:hypothetical protein